MRLVYYSGKLIDCGLSAVGVDTSKSRQMVNVFSSISFYLLLADMNGIATCPEKLLEDF